MVHTPVDFSDSAERKEENIKRKPTGGGQRDHTTAAKICVVVCHFPVRDITTNPRPCFGILHSYHIYLPTHQTACLVLARVHSNIKPYIPHIHAVHMFKPSTLLHHLTSL